MKISRRDFLKGTATSLFLAGFNLPALATSSRKKNLVGYYVTRRNGWALCSSSYWR
jgi:hypothetical protein